MNTTNKHVEGILNRISGTFNLQKFLVNTIQYGVEKLGCSGGSAFLFDNATGKLELFAHTYSYPEKLYSFVEPGQDIIGSAFKENKLIMLDKNQIDEYLLPYRLPGNDNRRAIVAIPTSLSNNPEAVFCFDFVDKNSKITGLMDSETNSVYSLRKEITSQAFINALRRTRFNQAVLDIRTAGEGPGRLREEVNDFLTRLPRICSETGKPKPDIANIQLVDRRRGVIRTIQGFGLPLSFQTSFSHSLEDNDIQSHTVRSQEFHLIIGNDERLDQGVYHKYSHWKLVRLWMPLFPVPPSWLAEKPGQSLDTMLRERMTWLDCQDVIDKDGKVIGKKHIGQWKPGFQPPSRLVYGTLEIGFELKKPEELSFEIFTPELANWFAAQAYKMSEKLYRATLDGSLESIGRIAASASRADFTHFIVTSSEWRTPEKRAYPLMPDWSSAVPEKISFRPPAMKIPAAIEFYTDVSRLTGYNDEYVKEMQKILTESAQEAAHLALRLDDYASDPYVLMEEEEEHGNLGTFYPDQGIKSVLQEISRETGAAQCILYLFEEKTPSSPAVSSETVGYETNMELLGVLGWWPEDEAGLQSTVQKKEIINLAKRVAKDKKSSFENVPFGNTKQSAAVLPLELSDRTTAVLVVIFSGEVLEYDIELGEFESRIARWTHRLSLRRMVQANRFSLLMRELREKIALAREHAAGEEETRHIDVFGKQIVLDFIEQFTALGVVFSIYSESTAELSRVERFWCCRTSNKKPPQTGSDIFLGSPSSSPGRTALKKSDLVIYGPKEDMRPRWTGQLDQEFLNRAEKYRDCGKIDQAKNLERIVALARGEESPSTMVVIPVSSFSRPDENISGAISVFLSGEHQYSETQRSLIMEVGTLVAEALGQMRSLDRQTFEAIQSKRFDYLRNRFGMSSTADDVVGHLFKGMGRKSNTKTSKEELEYWNLAEDAVLWLMSKVSKVKELVVRSGRGQALAALEGIQVTGHNQHPLLSRELKLGEIPKNEFPGLANFRIWTFSLSENNMDPIRTTYAALGNRKWLLSFPLLHADGRIRGVIDCLLDEPLLPEQEAALQSALHELSILFCYSLDSCRYKQVASFSRKLSINVMSHLSAFHSQEAYQTLVERIRDEFSCTHCDLFIGLEGKMTLFTTTREWGPTTEAERLEFTVAPSDGKEIVENCLVSGKPQIFHSSTATPSLKHMSPRLASLFADDYRFERLVIPLKLERGDMTSGLLGLRGPILPQYGSANDGNTEKVLKKSKFFNHEHLQYAVDLGVVVQLAVMMAGLVDRQSWLVDQLQHQLGQPLQVLRGVSELMLNELARGTFKKDFITSSRDNLNRSFDLVREARNQLAIYAKMGQPKHVWSYERIDLSKQVMECCKFMEPAATQKKQRLTTRDVQTIKPVWGQTELLRTAFLNLLENAIKYSYSDHTTEVALKEDGDGEIQITVTNFGIGIPPGDMERIFEPYFRSKVPDARGERQGTGIGLAIVKHAMEYAHSGKVEVTSDPLQNISRGNKVVNIANIPHKTTFTISLKRASLEELYHKKPKK